MNIFEEGIVVGIVGTYATNLFVALALAPIFKKHTKVLNRSDRTEL